MFALFAYIFYCALFINSGHWRGKGTSSTCIWVYLLHNKIQFEILSLHLIFLQSLMFPVYSLSQNNSWDLISSAKATTYTLSSLNNSAGSHLFYFWLHITLYLHLFQDIHHLTIYTLKAQPEWYHIVEYFTNRS